MVNGINGSIGQYNGYLNGKVQYPLVQGYSYQPQTVSFQGTPQPAEETAKKKGGAVKKGIIGTLVGVAVAAAALYAGVKTGKLTKVENASKWTEKLQNLAFEGGNYVKKGVDFVAAKFKKGNNGEMKPLPEKDANGQLYFQFAPNEASKA